MGSRSTVTIFSISDMHESEGNEAHDVIVLSHIGDDGPLLRCVLDAGDRILRPRRNARPR